MPDFAGSANEKKPKHNTVDPFQTSIVSNLSYFISYAQRKN